MQLLTTEGSEQARKARSALPNFHKYLQIPSKLSNFNDLVHCLRKQNKWVCFSETVASHETDTKGRYGIICSSNLPITFQT